MQPNEPLDPDMRAAGPGAVEEAQVDVKPLLDGASEYEYVEILNPLPVDFVAKFGVTRAIRGDVRIVTNKETPTITNDESDIRRNYGLDLRNKDHTGRANIVNRVTIKSGHTIRVLGNEAQVIVNQLVTEMLQRRGKRLMLADPTQRNLIEQEIIKRRDSVESILGRSPASIQDQLHDAVQPEEVEFPDAHINEESNERQLSQPGQATQQPSVPGTGTTYVPKHPGGRPRKTPLPA